MHRLGRLLVVAAHFDDEVLGAGGLLGSAPGSTVLVLCDPYTKGRKDLERQALSLEAADMVARTFGIKYEPAGLEDEQLRLADAVDAIEQAIARNNANVIVSHWSGDMNQDHRVTADAATIAARLSRTQVRALFAMEIPSSSDVGDPPPPSGAAYQEISWAAKSAMLEWYRHELYADRSPEVVRALATTRGAQVGVEYAEMFPVRRLAFRAE